MGHRCHARRERWHMARTQCGLRPRLQYESPDGNDTRSCSVGPRKYLAALSLSSMAQALYAILEKSKGVSHAPLILASSVSTIVLRANHHDTHQTCEAICLSPSSSS